VNEVPGVGFGFATAVTITDVSPDLTTAHPFENRANLPLPIDMLLLQQHSMKIPIITSNM
jgi:hypothetical protein